MADLQLAVISGSIRQGRKGAGVAEWVMAQAAGRPGADYTLVDLRDHPLPPLDEPIPPAGTPSDKPEVQAWSALLTSFDGYVFVTPEYNRSYPGVLKNALDSVYPELNNKAAAFVGYGSVLGARAIEALRLVSGELQMADVRQQVGFGSADFEDRTVLTPTPQHAATAATMLDQLEAWAEALKGVRDSGRLAAGSMPPPPRP